MLLSMRALKVAVEGCCHGELNNIYELLETAVDVLLICGDFQAIRNYADMSAISIPPKYKRLGDFCKYYSGEKIAPVLTVFIGGNHECSSYLRELQYGGWVAPNIYFLGEFGSIWINGVRITGISGIYNERTFRNKRLHQVERLPYSEETVRSAYHVKPKSFLKMVLMNSGSQHDIVLSHDWPQHVEKQGNLELLLKMKPFFRQDISRGRLGSPLNSMLLSWLRPRYWFSSHLHVKYEALITHQTKRCSDQRENKMAKRTKHNAEEINIDMDDEMTTHEGKGETNTVLGEETNIEVSKEQQHNPQTHFVALDKCLPKRKFLEIFDIVPRNNAEFSMPSTENAKGMKPTIFLDKRAIAVNKVVEDFFQNKGSHVDFSNLENLEDEASSNTKLLQSLCKDVESEIARLDTMHSENFELSSSFKQIAPSYKEKCSKLRYWDNNQTLEFCNKFGIPYKSLESTA